MYAEMYDGTGFSVKRFNFLWGAPKWICESNIFDRSNFNETGPASQLNKGN